ncbi:GNAT family N-acetyltransferase [Shewanella dokdonensis]|nr:peptidogalycan biosysnthesis protein [Shewanella dokdonensis]MCL1074945.1 GNAT family N-acetyltransferase [Shewanella dokdonensis]
MPKSVWECQFIEDISKVPAIEWDACMASTNPFTRHAFLWALEQSGSVGGDSGWRPYHLLLYRQQQLVAVMPLYQKSDSWGEYVFDWAWADAYQRYGVAYYPKLVSAIPFTPVTGNRLAIHPQAKPYAEAIYQQVSGILKQQLQQFSSWHGLFLEASECQQWQSRAELTLLRREGCQFHWFNRDYASFDDFLAALTSRKRKQILKERAKVQHLHYHWFAGDAIANELWQRFYYCYQMTYLKRSGHGGYLSGDFFLKLGRLLADNVRLLLVCRDNEPPEQAFAAALYLADEQQHVLYGRYWGTLQELDGLHFEACYYQGLEYAIRHGFSCFNAGAQGEHKVLRGFEPVMTQSLHAIAAAEFQHAIEHFCAEERQHNQQYVATMRQALPFKHSD